MVTGKTVSPNTTSYNLKNIDRCVYFDRLNAGTYYYIVKATNSAGTKILVNAKFTVSNFAVGDWGTLTPNGYYAIQSKVSGKYLDGVGGRTTSRTNVWVYTKNNSDAQK